MIEDRSPRYLSLHAAGGLVERARAAVARMSNCDLCARYCRVDRLASVAGAACRTGRRAVVASAGAHFGEERPITGSRGSGTVFFAWCNLRCIYCQNWEISWQGEGREVSAEELADIMLSLQRQGCHNVNLVSPSHVVAQILEALAIAADRGLRIPLVYNTGGFDSPEALALLDGVIDIYMPDIKYADPDVARKHSKVHDYVRLNRAAVVEMHRQVGDLVLDSQGIAVQGLLVRHLVLPNGLAGTTETLQFLAEHVSRETYLNIMDQYRPGYRAAAHAELARRPTRAELTAAFEAADRLGLRRLDDRTGSWLLA
ncbi:MAG: radical SAM protein [Rhodospirillales bacterium]|nr:MAG: radical SAM protein [Rhodospirillales bacterium]